MMKEVITNLINKMKRKQVVIAILVLLFLPAVITGYTYSVVISGDTWFTDREQTPVNRFTAGTVIVEAGDIEGELIVKNTTTDCEEIELEITNSGSKYSYVRALLEGDWSYAYHTNTATVYSYVSDNIGTMLTATDSASYVDGTYRGNFQSSYSYDISGLSWFTDYDGTQPLRISPTPGNTTPGDGTGNEDGSVNGPINGGSDISLGSPIVDGLFYAKVDNNGNINPNGVSDSERYQLYATGSLGSEMFTYLDGNTLYVAVVVSRNVNDNVFDRNRDDGPGGAPYITPYIESALWGVNAEGETVPEGDIRPFNHLVNSEYMGFEMQMGECTWEWKQAYAKHDGANWYSSYLLNQGTPPSGYDAATSIVWNLNKSTWDYTLDGLTDNSKWKSPYDNPDDVTALLDDSYPSNTSLPITFSYNHLWEWPMVYEFSVDLGGLSNCGTIDQLLILNSSVHHSPSKTGESDEFFTPRVEFEKQVSIDGGTSYLNADSMPYPLLPEGVRPIFKFVVKNTGDVNLNIERIDDDTFGVIFIADGSPITLAPGASHSFYYPNEQGTWDESVWNDFLANSLIKHSGGLDVQFCDDDTANVDWVKHTDGYFYNTKALAPGETTTLCLKVCPIGVPEGWQDYVFINLKAFVEAVQASNNAVYKVWFSDIAEPGPYPIAFQPKPNN